MRIESFSIIIWVFRWVLGFSYIKARGLCCGRPKITFYPSTTHRIRLIWLPVTSTFRKIAFGHERKTFCVRRGHPKGLYRHPEGHSGQWPETLFRKAFGSRKTVYRGRRRPFWINKLEFIRTKLLSFLF